MLPFVLLVTWRQGSLVLCDMRLLEGLAQEALYLVVIGDASQCPLVWECVPEGASAPTQQLIGGGESWTPTDQALLVYPEIWPFILNNLLKPKYCHFRPPAV